MSKQARGRTYLQQLAQPVARGETALTARVGVAAYSTDLAPQVPEIQESFHMPEGMRTTVRPHSMSTRREEVATKASLKPRGPETIKDAARNVPDPGPEGNGGVASVSAEPGLNPARPRTEARYAQSQWKSAAENVDANVSSAMAHGARTRGARSERASIETPGLDSATTRERMIANGPSPSTVEADRARQRVGVAAARIADESKNATESGLEKHAAEVWQRPSVARQDPLVEPAAARPAEEAHRPRRTANAEPHADAGPRVRIGTVEIRAVLPASPAAPMPAPASKADGPMLSRGRSTAAEPLARGFAWSYGLVQG